MICRSARTTTTPALVGVLDRQPTLLAACVSVPLIFIVGLGVGALEIAERHLLWTLARRATLTSGVAEMRFARGAGRGGPGLGWSFILRLVIIRLLLLGVEEGDGLLEVAVGGLEGALGLRRMSV